MKKVIKSIRWQWLMVLAILLTSSILTSFPAQIAHAAGSKTEQPLALLDKKTGYSCYAELQGGTTSVIDATQKNNMFIQDSNATYDGLDGGTDGTNDLRSSINNTSSHPVPSSLKDVFKGTNDPNNQYTIITFDSANNSKQCKQSALLLQSKTDPLQFYGFITEGKCDNRDTFGHVCIFDFLAARVDISSQTISFNNPIDGKTVSNMGINNFDATRFTSGAIAGGNSDKCPTGGLLSKVTNNSKQLQDCLTYFSNNAQYAAKYINQSTISFAGAQFVLQKWGKDGNDHETYAMTTAPLFDPTLPTYNDNSQEYTSITIKDDNLTLNKVSDFANKMNTFSGYSNATFNLHNSHVNNLQVESVLNVDKGAYNLVANYWAKDKKIQTIFSNGDNHETEVIDQPYDASDPTATDYYIATGGSGCQGDNARPSFSIPGGLANATTGSTVSAVWNLSINESGCAAYGRANVQIYIEDSSTSAPIGGACGTSTTPNCSDTSKPTCESSGFPLSWIICQGINLLATSIDGLYNNFITPLLVVNPLTVKNAAGDPSEIFVAWSSFRVYGDAFLVIALLVIVFGESIGGGLIDAYTAKKVLPRILIAGILVNLSFYIVAALVDIMNVAGGGLRELLQAPFHQSGGFQLNVTVGGSTLAWGAAILGGWAISGIIPELAALFAVFVLLPAILILFAIMLTILIRQALIVFLVAVSPVAFAMYCLPNTEQYFKKWWDALFKALLVYPIITVLFALGNIMSVVVGNILS
jgi:hypothetical protein